MLLLTERHHDKISGVISCYDRVVIQGTLPDWCYDQGMTRFLYMNQIKIFDFPDMANNLRLELRDNTERIAKENDLGIEFIRKIGGFRKEARIKEILLVRGSHPGLVHIFSAMETCTCYKPNHNKNTGKTALVYATDVIFTSRDALTTIYEPLIRNAIHSVNRAYKLGREGDQKGAEQARRAMNQFYNDLRLRFSEKQISDEIARLEAAGYKVGF